MIAVLVLLGCGSQVVVSETDTGDQVNQVDQVDTAAPDTADTAAADTGCGAIEVSPLEVAWPWPADAADVRELELEGCTAQLVVSCPTWLQVTAPATVDGAAVVALAPDPASYPAAATCYVGGQVVNVAIGP